MGTESQEQTSSQSKRRIAVWRDGLSRGHDFDNWGQVVEATDEYTKVTEDIKAALAVEAQFSEEQAKFLSKLAFVVGLRAEATQDLTSTTKYVELGDIKRLADALHVLPVTVPSFPVAIRDEFKDLVPAMVAAPAKAQVEDDDDDDEPGEDQSSSIRGGSLQPRQVFPGKTSISIRIDKIKLKDATTFIEPIFTISVKDANGKDLCKPQDTAPTNRKDDFVHFNQTVEIQKALEDLPLDCAIFLEFKHFKPRKSKLSTKCFCLLEMDEIRKGSFPLEIYAKPTDFRRKKLNLLTEKQHYLYVTINLNTS